MRITAKRVVDNAGQGSLLVQDLHGVKTKNLPVKLPAWLLEGAAKGAEKEGMSVSLLVSIAIATFLSDLEYIEGYSLEVTGEERG